LQELVELVGTESEAYCLTAYAFDLAAREVLFPRFFQSGVATAAAELLNPDAAHPSPADEVWLPLDALGGQPARRRLHQLLGGWPHVPPPVTDDDAATGPDSPVLLAPPPAPMPPATSRGPSTTRR
jgi:hypothetical protein